MNTGVGQHHERRPPTYLTYESRLRPATARAAANTTSCFPWDTTQGPAICFHGPLRHSSWRPGLRHSCQSTRVPHKGHVVESRRESPGCCAAGSRSPRPGISSGHDTRRGRAIYRLNPRPCRGKGRLPFKVSSERRDVHFFRLLVVRNSAELNSVRRWVCSGHNNFSGGFRQCAGRELRAMLSNPSLP